MKCKIINKHGLFFLFILLIFTSSCKKEYSYEGEELIALPSVPLDTIQIIPVELPSCDSCNETAEMKISSWSFKTGNSLHCGRAKGIIELDRKSFTFAGPSTCFRDKGLIFTVYLNPNILDKDTYNLTATSAAFFYYHAGNPYILMNRPDQLFNLKITSYIHATRIATGIFNGIGYGPDGRGVIVASGKFIIRLP